MANYYPQGKVPSLFDSVFGGARGYGMKPLSTDTGPEDALRVALSRIGSNRVGAYDPGLTGTEVAGLDTTERDAALKRVLDSVSASGNVKPARMEDPSLNFGDVKKPLLILAALTALAQNDPNRNAAIPKFLQGAQAMKSSRVATANENAQLEARRAKEQADAAVELSKIGYSDVLERNATAERRQESALDRAERKRELRGSQDFQRQMREFDAANARALAELKQSGTMDAAEVKAYTALLEKERATYSDPRNGTEAQERARQAMISYRMRLGFSSQEADPGPPPTDSPLLGNLKGKTSLLSAQAQKALASAGLDKKRTAELAKKIEQMPEELKLKAISIRAAANAHNAAASASKERGNLYRVQANAGGFAKSGEGNPAAVIKETRLQASEYKELMTQLLEMVAPKLPQGAGRLVPSPKTKDTIYYNGEYINKYDAYKFAMDELANLGTMFKGNIGKSQGMGAVGADEKAKVDSYLRGTSVGR